MAPRVKEKPKKTTGRTRAKAASTPAVAAPARIEARIKALEQERDRLKSDLEAARLRIAALEESRSAVANRIDWVIERLGDVVQRGD